MRKLKIYIDTSVIGGYYDDEFSTDTKLLFNEILKGYNSINMKNGYPSLEIRSPKDLINYEN